VNAKVIPILPMEQPDASGSGFAHALLRIYQVFVHVEGVRVPIRHPVLNVIPWRLRPSKTFGFYTVLMLAAGEGAKPPMLLSLARETLADAFGNMSKTSPEDWVIKMEQWREVGMAPPMFQQEGCVEDGWGAAWYELEDEKAKGQRYRLVKVRLWKGHRAKPRRLRAHDAESRNSDLKDTARVKDADRIAAQGS